MVHYDKSTDKGKGRKVLNKNESKARAFIWNMSSVLQPYIYIYDFHTQLPFTIQIKFICMYKMCLTTSCLMLRLCWLHVILVNNTPIHSISVHSNAILWIFLTEIQNKYLAFFEVHCTIFKALGTNHVYMIYNMSICVYLIISFLEGNATIL